MHITLSKDAVARDMSALRPGGGHVGAPAMTSRLLGREELETIADILDRTCKLVLDLQKSSGKKLKDFGSAPANCDDVVQLRMDVIASRNSFSMPDGRN